MKKIKDKNYFVISRLKKCGCVLAAVIFFVSIFDSNSAAQEKSEKEMRVLFIGNSLTYVNNLPEIVAELADSAKQRKLSFKTVAYPDYSLEDHWKKREVHKLLAKEKWDYVVLQQGTSALEESRKLLIAYTKKFAEEIIRVGAKPTLYGVWATRERKQDFERAIESYRLAAKDVNGVFLPVSAAWLETWRRDPNIELYAPDGLHPSAAGSYLAALVIFSNYTNKTRSV